MEKGIWLFHRPEDTHCFPSLNLSSDGPKESCQNDVVKASQAQLQQGQLLPDGCLYTWQSERCTRSVPVWVKDSQVSVSIALCAVWAILG